MLGQGRMTGLLVDKKGQGTGMHWLLLPQEERQAVKNTYCMTDLQLWREMSRDSGQ
jgi:hypothetical protein